MNDLPTDLSAALEEWRTVYRQLSVRPSTALRRRLIALSAKVLIHPYWQGRRTGAWAALHGAHHGRTTS